MSFKESFKSFASQPYGYAILLAIIILVTALSLFELGIIFGALIMLLLGFGVPVYIGWNKSFKTLLIVAIVITAAMPPVWAAFTNEELFTPYAPLTSNDSVIQDAKVTPFTSPPAADGLYHFSALLVSQQFPYNGTNRAMNFTEAFLWVTDCPYDGVNNNTTSVTNNACGGSPDYLHEFPPYMIKNPGAESRVRVYFNVSLPGNNIIYYVIIANFTVATYHGEPVYSFSCLGYCTLVNGVAEPVSQESYYWNEGPITGSWGYIYAVRILPTFYLIGAGLGGVLIAVVLIYRWLKIRERARHKKAADSAGGTAIEGESGCPACGAVIKSGESFCWKCGKPISEQPTTDSGTSSATSDTKDTSPPLK